jgi:uncharacterized caspase-like protein
MRLTARVPIFSLLLLAMSGFPGFLNSAAAQQQEKRIALVVGNGAYAKAPLATAANDAGLIAQTLQAAGFDVIGARDLDGDALRRSFRDFIQKAQSSGPDTVAMVYLAGYGLQLAGENYFVPVDSAINRDTDIPIEAVRIGDYVRHLASLPLKANIVVLDAARQQPFVEGQIASGLALVEADPHMLIAFSAAPGTVAPAEQGPYGAYAQSLAEMIRTGGLPLPEVFNRVRLRVNDATKGAQVPWDTQKIDAQFMFFERAPDAPAVASPDQVAAIRNKPIRDLGVQEAYTAALERDTLQGYEDFLAAYAGDPLAKRVRVIVAARREAITWRRTYRTDTPNAYWSYLRRYPQGPHAADARRRLAILTAPLEPPPTFAVIDYDVPPPPPDEIVYVDRPVLAFSDPEFDFVPPPPPPVYYLPPPPPDFVVLEPPPPPIGLFVLPQPLFVPIPAYVSAPVYVAPPPNNIIYTNIHNTTVINNVINQPPPPAAPAPAPGGPNVQPNARGPASPPVAAAAPRAATPALPPAVAQRATLIQQGKLPVPPSASINPAVRPGTLGTPGAPSGQRAAPNAPQPANVAPNAIAPNPPPQGPQALPRANTLPVPGAKGAPPAPPAAAGTSPAGASPNARLAPPQPGSPPPGPAAPNAPGTAGAPKPPAGVAAPTAGQPRPGVATLPPPANARPTVVPEAATKPSAAPHAPPPPPRVAAPPPRVAAPSPPPPRAAAPPPPPPRAAAPPPPPPRVAAPPPPPPRVAAPPPPPPRAAAPPPPPPRMAAPPPPPPRVAAPPPPPPRPAPPPQVARPAPPPPAAAAKKCPPNVPRC